MPKSMVLFTFFALLFGSASPALALPGMEDFEEYQASPDIQVELQKKEDQVKKLVIHYASNSGCCPNISVSGMLCGLICCPCCAPCIVEGCCQETFSFPSTRRKKVRENIRQGLLGWKKMLNSLEENNPRRREYNDYVNSIAETTANSTGKEPLFTSDRDFQAFLL